MWFFQRAGTSGFSSVSTAEEVTQGIDGSGLTAILTGASSGIGVETARVLALRGVHVIMAVRNTDVGKSVKDAISKEIPDAKIEVMELDLSSMASVRNFAAEYKATGLPLNILINNAGLWTSKFTLSKDDIELHFATNHLGHFLLTNLLVDTMKRTAAGSLIEGRVVIVSSTGHRFVNREGIQFDKINEDTRYKYGQSKLANILHATELSRHFKEEGLPIIANSLHPGNIGDTSLMRDNPLLRSKPFVESNHTFPTHSCSRIIKIVMNCNLEMHPGIGRVVFKFFLKSVQQGAATTCYVALHPQVKGVSGEYFADCNLSKPSDLARNADLAKKLWDFSFNLTNHS